MNHEEVMNDLTKFLNLFDLSGVSLYRLSLKIGAPIIHLRNINPPQLCNGTRFAIKKLSPNVIGATVLNGKSNGMEIPTDMPFDFKRQQFPIRLAFRMINLSVWVKSGKSMLFTWKN